MRMESLSWSTQRRCSGPLQRAALIVVLVTLGAVPWENAAAAWPTFRGDNARSGLAPRGISDEPRVAWKVGLGGSVDGSPIVVDGRVFVGTNRGLFAAINATTGEVLWRAELEGAVCSAAAASGDRLAVGTARGFLYCLGLDGGILWRVHAWDAVVASPLVVGEAAVWGSMDGLLHCTRLNDGTTLWERPLAGGVSGSPCGGADLVHVGDEKGVVWAVRPESGEVVWRRETGCPVMAAPVLAGEVLLVPLVSPSQLTPPKVPYLLALDHGTGEPRWQVVEARSVFASPLWTDAGVIYVSVEGYLSETLLRCQRRDGAVEVWRQRIGGVVDSSPAATAERAYFGAQDGCLYVADLRSGTVISRVQLAPKIFSSPALEDGRLHVGASDGCLYCLE